MLNMAVRWAQSKTIGHSWGLGWFGMGLKEDFGQVTKPFQLGCVRNLRPSHLGYMKDSSTGQGEQESRRARGRRKRGPTSICPVPDVSPALSLCAPAALAFPKHARLVCTSGPLYLLFPLPVRFFAELAPSHFFKCMFNCHLREAWVQQLRVSPDSASFIFKTCHESIHLFVVMVLGWLTH